MTWQPETQPKGKPPVEKTKGAETVQRLIDADALVKFIDYGHLNNPDEKLYSENDIREMIDMMPTIDTKPHWIPCSERLPEDNDYKPFSYYEDGAVLFCTKNGKVGFGWYYESTKEWANEDDCTPGEVIAWMPLPEPYKGDKE